MPIWLMVLGGLFLVGLVVSFVVVEWRSSHGTLKDRRATTWRYIEREVRP